MRRPPCTPGFAVAVLTLVAGCKEQPGPPRMKPMSLADVSAVYGPLVAAGNHPTPDQHGTGDRMGLFRERDGTVWGLPLTIDDKGTVYGCAPPGLHDAAVTDTLPPDVAEVVGGTNAPTGWRGGTGKLELLFRNTKNEMHWVAVSGREVATAPLCWDVPGPRQQFHYYRLAPPKVAP